MHASAFLYYTALTEGNYITYAVLHCIGLFETNIFSASLPFHVLSETGKIPKYAHAQSFEHEE
jgi:hypothetical protein